VGILSVCVLVHFYRDIHICFAIDDTYSKYAKNRETFVFIPPSTSGLTSHKSFEIVRTACTFYSKALE
jgi:hypothetical protein